MKLSKSTFIRGLQCEKSLYFYKHHFDLKDSTNLMNQSVFEQGTAIGILAQKLFPNGVDPNSKNQLNKIESVEKTFDFIKQGETIVYEATFLFDEVIAALDILVRDNEGWKAYEVKSSTGISDTYIKDAGIQYYTIINSGIDLKDISIIYINNQYVKNGEIDIGKLFTIESVREQVLEYLPQIPSEIRRLKNVIGSAKAPQIDIGPHCSEPYDCDFKGTCWKHIPEYSIFDISRLNKDKKFDLYNQGALTLDDIDLSQTDLNPNQILQVQSEVNGTSHIDIDKIRNFTSGLNYPLYFLDFETIGPAVPIYDGSRPYQQLVFQYSLHIKETFISEIKHREYLADSSQDPRIGFIEQIIEDCGRKGDILVYNIGFERGKLYDLIDTFPRYSNQLLAIVRRLKDLMIPFQQKWFYTPKMKGSYSIKLVLPALVPELSYNDLVIKEGGTASNTFLSMVNGSFEGDEKETRKHLLEYCKMDTFAMVKILEKLSNV